MNSDDIVLVFIEGGSHIRGQKVENIEYIIFLRNMVIP